MKIKRVGIKEFLRRIWLISADKTKTSESVCKQSSHLKLELNSLLRQIIPTVVLLCILFIFQLKMMKQLLFVLFLATVVFMVSAQEAEAGAEGENNGSSMTTLATASLIGLAFNVLMNIWK